MNDVVEGFDVEMFSPERVALEQRERDLVYAEWLQGRDQVEREKGVYWHRRTVDSDDGKVSVIDRYDGEFVKVYRMKCNRGHSWTKRLGLVQKVTKHVCPYCKAAEDSLVVTKVEPGTLPVQATLLRGSGVQDNRNLEAIASAKRLDAWKQGNKTRAAKEDGLKDPFGDVPDQRDLPEVTAQSTGEKS